MSLLVQTYWVIFLRLSLSPFLNFSKILRRNTHFVLLQEWLPFISCGLRLSRLRSDLRSFGGCDIVWAQFGKAGEDLLLYLLVAVCMTELIVILSYLLSDLLHVSSSFLASVLWLSFLRWKDLCRLWSLPLPSQWLRSIFIINTLLLEPKSLSRLSSLDTPTFPDYRQCFKPKIIFSVFKSVVILLSLL